MAQLVRAPPCHGGGREFESLLGRLYGIIAQLGEHLPYKQRVIGSSPIGPIYICGEIAQLARACGSYPQCRGFESPSRYDWNASEKSGAFYFHDNRMFAKRAFYCFISSQAKGAAPMTR